MLAGLLLAMAGAYLLGFIHGCDLTTTRQTRRRSRSAPRQATITYLWDPRVG